MDEYSKLEVFMEISDKLLCLFSAEISEEDDRYVVEVPKREIDTGSVEAGDTYRVVETTDGLALEREAGEE